MIMDRGRDLHRPLSGGDIGRKVNEDLKRGFLRKVADSIDNIMFCSGVEFFFMEWCGIE